MSDKIEHMFIETQLESWEDIFKLNQRFLSKFVYRGQINENWNLSTSLERHINKHFINLVDTSVFQTHEQEMIKEFQWKYPLYSTNCPEKQNYIEWLTIMQHYGAATRLLDFSHSIFVAIYMAIVDNGDNGALWAINKIPHNFKVFDKYRETYKVTSASNDLLDQYTLDLANDILTNTRVDSAISKQLFVIKPQLCNERISRQQGLFVMPSDIRCSFIECLKPYLHTPEPIKIPFHELISYSQDAKYKQEDISLIKIVIHRRLNFKIMKYLRGMNVTTEILFPGLEGLAKSLNYKRFSFRDEE